MRREDSPIFSFRKSFNLLIEINNNFLVLLLQQMSCFLRLQVDILQELAELAQLDVTLAVDFELKQQVGGYRSAHMRENNSFTWLSQPPSASSKRSDSEITCTLKSHFSRSIWRVEGKCRQITAKKLAEDLGLDELNRVTFFQFIFSVRLTHRDSH